MKSFDEIIEKYILENRWDYIGLWQICNVAECDFNASEQKIQQVVLDIAKQMLLGGFQAVDLADGGKCIPWPNQELEYVLSRIEKEWNELGRVPNIGDICWFDLSSNSERRIT